MSEKTYYQPQTTYYQQLGEQPLEQLEAQVAEDWRVGDVILDLYEIRALLGEGGMGKVYRAHHRGWNLDLAVKCPKGEVFASQQGKEDYIREAETWIELGLHPHICSCYYVRTLGGVPRLFAECVEGGSLESWIENRKLYEGGKEKTLERILDIAIQFAWGLGYAHDQGLVHQDVKPHNVLMTPEGIAKVTDFGLAKVRAVGGQVSAGGYTPAYCSPEQAEGKALDHKTDMWSWAVSVLELFTGGVTWQMLGGEYAATALEDYLLAGVPESGIPTMPSGLAELLRQCFAERPEDRPQDMPAIAVNLLDIYQQVTGSQYTRPQPKPIDLRADSLNNRALSLWDLRQPEKALAAWEEALKADAHHPEATYNLGLTQWRKAQINDDALLERMREVGTSHPGDWMTAYLLAQVHLERGDVSSAVEIFSQIKEPETNQEMVIATRAQLNSHLAKTRKEICTFEGHTHKVTSVCLSSDGRFALSGSVDKTLMLWELESRRCLRTYEGNTAAVTTLWLSTDGRYTLSCSHAGTVKRWEVASGRCLKSFDVLKKGHDLTCIDISNDGRYVLVGSGNVFMNRDWMLNLWEVESERCLHTLHGHTAKVVIASQSLDGRYALSGSTDSTFKLWELGSGACLRSFDGQIGLLNSVCLSADGRYAVSGSPPRLWEVTSGRCLCTFDRYVERVESICLSIDGGYALTGNSMGVLRLWEVESGHCLRTFEGHTKEIQSVCLSSDGRYALSGSRDKTLKLWELQRGRCLRTFEGHTEWVTCVCLSTNGVHAFSGSWDKTLKMWDVKSGHCLRTFAGHTGFVSSACLSADGHLLLSGSYDKTLKLWDIDRGICLRTFNGHSGVVESVSLSADGRHALSGSRDKTLKLWEVQTGRCLRTLEEHKDIVRSVCLSADGRYALSGGRDETIKLWNVESGLCLHTIDHPSENIFDATLSADGNYALASFKSGMFKLWDVTSGRLSKTFTGHTKELTACCLGPDNRFFLTGSRDKTFKLWEAESERCLSTFTGHTGEITSICLSADGNFALSGSEDKTLKLWQVQPNIRFPAAQFMLSRAKSVQESLSSQSIYNQALMQARHAIELDRAIEAAKNIRLARAQPEYQRDQAALEIWQRLFLHLPHQSFTAGWESAVLEGHKGPVSSVCMSRDGRYVLSGSHDGTLKLWEVGTGRCLRTFQGHTGQVNCVRLSFDGRSALSMGSDLRLWELESGRCVRTLKGPKWYGKCACMSVDGHYVLSGLDLGILQLWEVESSRCLRNYEGHSSAVTSVCLTPDGRSILSSSFDKTLKLWDLASGCCLHTFEGHSNTVESMSMSGDGRLVLSGSADKTLRLWEVESGVCLRTFEGHTESVQSVCLSANSRYALSGGYDKTMKLWELGSGRCLRTFEGHIDWVRSVYFSIDGRYALSGSNDKTMKLWILDWELEDRDQAEWDEGARVYLENFLTLHTPRARLSLQDRWLTDEEINTVNSLSGKPSWTENDFHHLMYELGCRGFGWLRPEGIQRELKKRSRELQKKNDETIKEKQKIHLTGKACIRSAQSALAQNQYLPARASFHQALAMPIYARNSQLLDQWYQAGLNHGRRTGLLHTHSLLGINDDENQSTALHLSADGHYALSGSYDKVIKLWDLANGVSLRSFSGHTDIKPPVCLSTDGCYLLATKRESSLGSRENIFNLWDLQNGRCLQTYKGHTGGVSSVYLSNDRRRILSGSGDKTIKLWEVETGRCLRTFEGHTSAVATIALNGDGSRILSGSGDKTIKLWEVESGRCLKTFEGHTLGVSSVCLSTDGRFALSGSYDKTLKLWELESGRCLHTFEGHTNRVDSVCLSADGHFALSGSADLKVMLWDLEGMCCIRSFWGSMHPVVDVCFSPDGRYIISRSDDDSLKIWGLTWDYDFPEPIDWDEDARPYLENFLVNYPKQKRSLTLQSLLRRPTWEEIDFQKLLITLRNAGYGWLRPEGVRRKLEEMAKER